MKNIRSLSHLKQKGFSLIELMVAAMLGLILLAGVIQIFLSSNQSYILQDKLATIQEEGRFALIYLENQIEMAGWNAEDNNDNLPAIDFDNSSNDTNDTLALSFVKTVNAVDNLDCNGNVVDSGLVTNQFSVNADDELVCKGLVKTASSTTFSDPQTLISGVDSFQVLYGVETGMVCPDGSVDRYMTSEEVVNANLTNNILSVRVGLLLKSDQDVFSQNEKSSFQILDKVFEYPSASATSGDKLLRRLFQQTIFMPNSAFKFLVNSDSAVKCLSGF